MSKSTAEQLSGQSIRFIPGRSQVQIPFPPPFIWPVGQAVKTRPFHGCNMGSIPVRVINKKTGFVPVFFVYYPRTGNRHTQNACVLNWVRIFDQDRCLLASMRSGENSSRSEPSRLLLHRKSTGHLLLFKAKPSHLYIYKHTPQCHFIENSYFIIFC